MRIIAQRVKSASVTVEGETVGRIGPGILLLLGFNTEDQPNVINKWADKVLKLRIFDEILPEKLE